MSKDYANPDVLVSTDWVDNHKADRDLRLLEVDVDTAAYDQGHILGAQGLNWTSQLCDRVRRDVLSPPQFETLCQNLGITRDTTIVFYGDSNNWFAAYAFWQFRYYQHPESKLKLMNGGRSKWITEGRALVQDRLPVKPTTYKVSEPDPNVRIQLHELFPQIHEGRINLIDVRSPAEYKGDVIAPPGMKETAQRGGHIPGARNVPWALTLNEDGTFKSREALEELYRSEHIDWAKPVVTYCRIGERSAHTWFALTYLLGAKQVANYDGSWTEWGNLIAAPIER